MMKTRSNDGTLIAYWRSGSGAPLVLVHGTTANHTRWQSVLPAFQKNFTVYAIDRRGYGKSGDTKPYSIEREYEDIAAVINSIPEPVNLLGHSYGALCCLGAAPLTGNIARLVLYEPFIPTGSYNHQPGDSDRLQAMVDAGDRDGAVSTMFREQLKMSEQEINEFRSLPSWQVRLAGAHAIPRETRAEESYKLSPERLTAVKVPSLLLLGEESPPFIKAATEVVHEGLPNSRIAVMPGQQHIAMTTAPELFTREVIKFLNFNETPT